MILDESTPIWGPDGESLLTLAVRDSRLLPIGRVIRRSAEVPTDPDAKIQAMIALRITPEVASQYGAGPSAAGQAQVLPLEERHITLAYLGEIDGLERRRAHDFTRRWLTDSDWPTMEGRAQGWGTFIPPADSDDAKTVLWMSWDIPGLSEMRQNLIDELQANGFDLPSEHDFTPHETVAYYDTLPSRLPPFPESNPSQTFGSVVVGEDDTWTEYDFPMRMALRDGATISLTAALAAADGSWETIPGGEALVAAGGWDRNRGNAEALRRFWTVGRGGAKIRWNTPGDYSRCVRYLSKHLGPRAKGYCFSGDTEFLTRDGVMTFAEAVGTRQFVLTQKLPVGRSYKDVRTDDGYWVEAPIESFGEQRVLSVTLKRNGVRKTIRATPEHGWFTATGRTAGSVFSLRRTDELRKGMAFAALRPRAVVAEEIPANPGIMAGIVFGDGSYGHMTATGGRVDLHGEKIVDLLKYFDGARILPQKDLPSGLECVRVAGLPMAWRSLPSLEESNSYLYGWLAGYIATDGTVSKDGSISLSSNVRENLEFVQIVANRLGVPIRGIGEYMVSTNFREEPFETYRMSFGKVGFPVQMLLRERHRSALTAAAGEYERVRWVVESVVDHGEVEEVFCAVVPETESFVLTDNVWVHNCALRHKEMTRMWTGDMKHRILWGWGGKPGSYWAKVAAHEILDDPVESADFWVPSNHTTATMALTPMAGEAPMNDATNPLVMLLGGEPQAPVGFRIPLLLPEGVESGDGRTFKKGITEIRELPIPLLWQPSSMSGHDGAAIVGRIDSVERLDDGLGDAVGVFDTSPLAMEAVRMIRAGMLRGVSADLDQFEAKIKGKGPGTTEAKEKGKDDNTITPEKMDITKGRVMAATLVAKPAFEQCRIELIEAEPIPDGEYAHELTPDETELAALFAEFMEREAMATFSIVAAGSTAAPIYPPSSWFTDPGLSRPTHLTITDDGRVFGHIAAWHVDHIGMGFGTRPPRSRSNYSYFRTGIIRTEEGTDIRVGQLTLIGGHASLSADAREAVKHYDDTASAFADVAAGEDGHGIWVAGALRPTVTPEQVRIARASSPSGDWRPINGALELVAVCQVNVPGFPVVEARVASGRVLALVAAGVSPLLIERMASPEGLAVLADRARARIEAPLRQQALVASATIAHARMFSRQPVSAERRKADVGKGYAMPGGRYPIEDLADLKRAIRAYGRATEEDKPKVRKHIAKRARALGHPELIPEDWKNLSDTEVTLDAESLEESLFKDYSTERRAEMEKEGAAMKGGRYPISNIKDLKDAIHAYGRGDPKDKPAIRRHIAKRARALGHPELIPESWKNLSDSEVTLTVEPPEGAEFKDYSTESRKGMAKAGIALPDGSYPIKSVADLKNAIHAYGRAAEKDRAKVRRHIAKRARALGHPELIPEDWKGLTAGAMSRFRLEECVTNNWAMPDGRYPITCAVDLQRAVADYAIADIPDRTPVRRHLIRRAKELGCPDLLPSAWDIETAMVTNLPIGLVASLRSVRSEQWDESKVARNEIGRFRKIYYRLRNSPDAAKPEMRAALRAIREAGVTAQEQGATDADTARLAREALKEAAVSAQIDERTQVEVIEAAQDVSNMMRRFEVRGPETKMSFSQLPTDIQNAIERYLKQPNLEERITKHFGPFVEGKATRSIKDIVNFIERVVIDAHDYRKGRATEGMVSPERNT